jgi:glycosyltransferase involved in cell wall biosynthesis
MRILQVVPHYVPAYRFGGPQQVAHALGRALVRAGHQVVVCTTNQADETHDLEVALDAPVDVDGVTVYYEPTRFFRYWGFSPALRRRVAREMARCDVALVHAHYQYANWIGACLARRARRPYVVFAHGSLHRAGIAHKSALLKRLYLRLLEHQNFARALFLAFNAPEEKAYSWYGQWGEVVPSGIDPSAFEPAPPPGAFRERQPALQGRDYLLFLGRLDIAQKGLDLILPAFARLVHEQNPPQQSSPLCLVLAGPDEAGGAARLQALAQQLGIADRVLLPGLLTGNAKLAVLQDATAFVLPSRFEGLSIALLEALYSGLPMLVTDQIGLCREIERLGAGIVVPATTEALYGGLLRLADAGERAAMQGRGRALIAQHYTWDAIATGLIDRIQDKIQEKTN